MFDPVLDVTVEALDALVTTSGDLEQVNNRDCSCNAGSDNPY